MNRRTSRVLLIAVVAIIAVACSAGSPAPATPSGPGTAAAATGATPLPVPAGSPPASMTPSASGPAPVGGAIDTAKLLELEPAVVCSLLTAGEAETILGKALYRAPEGSSSVVLGTGTSCHYAASDTPKTGTFIKVEFSSAGFELQSQLMGSAPRSLTVAGLPAVAAEVDPSARAGQSRMVVQLSSVPTDPGLYILAPTVAAAQQVAEAVIPRLASVD